MNVLIDTNIIIDALTSREPFRQEAEHIFYVAANDLAELYISASMATDIYYIIHKYLHNSEKSKKIMATLYELFGILSVTNEDCINALASEVKDYEDAVVASCAIRSEMEYIVTRNVKDYTNAKIQIITPGEFLELVNEEC